MKKTSFRALLGILFIWILFAVPSLAGQVVTKETRSWAKEAVEQERALKTISAPNTVAILYFHNRSGLSDLDILQKGLALMLITDLSKVKEIQLVERVKIQAIVEELDIGVSGLVESGTASRVGRLLGVEHLIGGAIIKEEIDQFALTSSLLKVPVEEVSGHVMVKGKLLAELFRMEKDLLFEIINKLQIELSPEQEAELREFLTTDLKALLHLFEGIEQGDLGNYKKAAEYCEKALEEDPNLSQADDFFLELQELDLLREEPEAYFEPEGGIPVADSDDRDMLYDIDNSERETSLLDEGSGSIDLRWNFFSYTSDMLVDEFSLNQAIDMAIDDPALLVSINNGAFIPSVYDYGLQTVGVDEYGTRKIFLNPETIDSINENNFLAYAVQVEEDRLNTRILEMHQEAVKDEIRLDTINAALEHAELRIRDDWFTQNADARSGRVLKDEKGNWVRVQQYILRPDDKTVQMLNVCLRGRDSGDLAGLSTMDFTTQFRDSLPAGRDLRSLPWNEWLKTWSVDDSRYVNSPEYNDYEQVNPQLDSIYVKFTNPGNESLKESRWFDIRGYDVQYIISEQLTINNNHEPYDFTTGSPVSGQYAVVPNAANGNNPRGFDYVLGDGNRIKAAFYILGDGDRDDNQGTSEVDYSNMEFNDIWDALRVNEGYVTGDADIGNNNLEIAIDAENNFFAKPIDLVYIPMSRMLWKDDEF